MQSKTPGILPRILFEMFEAEFRMLQVQHEISFHRLSELDDEMFILDNHILFEKNDLNCLCQIRNEVLFRQIKSQTTTELKSISMAQL